jgi:hypothetical protein
MKDSYIMVYDGDQWNMLMKTDTIDNLYDSKIIHLEDKFDELLGTLDDPTRKKFKRFVHNIETSDIETSVKQRIKLLLYNARVSTQKNKKKMESITE